MPRTAVPRCTARPKVTEWLSRDKRTSRRTRGVLSLTLSWHPVMSRFLRHRTFRHANVPFCHCTRTHNSYTTTLIRR